MKNAQAQTSEIVDFLKTILDLDDEHRRFLMYYTYGYIAGSKSDKPTE